MKRKQQLSVGNTPFVQIERLTQADSAGVWGKCEFLNPTGTPKDRLYTSIIERLEQTRQISPGMTLVDASTGNGGGALARAAYLKGYKSVVVMPEGMTQERKDMIRFWRGQIIESPADAFLQGAETAARQYIAGRPEAYYLNQATTPYNRESMRSIGKEIVEECRRLNLKPDVFVCSIGTGGTYTGVATELEDAFPGILKVGIEVDKSAPLYAKRNGGSFNHRPHNLMGLGPGKIGGNLDEKLVDEIVTVSGGDAWRMMKTLVQQGLETGPTSGANVFVAREYAGRLGSSGMVVTILFDAAWKYISIWDGQYELYQDGSSADDSNALKEKALSR
jgi:cysteine synthase A